MRTVKVSLGSRSYPIFIGVKILPISAALRGTAIGPALRHHFG
jgi:hypothetical protein